MYEGTMVEHRLPHNRFSATALKYVAVSYVWGDSTFNVPGESSIETSLSVSTSLGHILCGVGKTGPLDIWIDQICINQRDCEEKKHQVSLMWRIFAAAEQVIGWLGPAFPGSGDALTDLVLFAGAFDEAYGEQFVEVVRRLFGQHFVPEDVLRHIQSVMLLGSDVRNRMLRLFSLPWFQRRWIAQEACLATNLRIQCGHQSISGAQLFRAISGIQTIITPIATPWLQRPFRNAFALLKTREMVQHAANSDHYISFPHTLQTLSFLDCSEDQDRINALFGIVQSSNSWFRPSYCPASELYVKFALAYMRHFRSLDILSFAGTTEPTRHRMDNNGVEDVLSIAQPADDLPSWVPDWRIRHRYLPIVPAEVELRMQRSKASTFALSFDPCRRSLTLTGKLLRTPIKPCGLPHLDGFETPEDPQYQLAVDPWCNRIFVNFLGMVDPVSASHYMSSKTFTRWFDSELRLDEYLSKQLLCFARTLIMDCKVSSYERPDYVVPQDKVWEYFLEYARLHLVADAAAASIEYADMAKDEGRMERAAAYGYLAEHVCRYRTLFLGDTGAIGLGSPGIAPGDRICFFSDSKTPFVVHPQGEHFELRGECYVDGLMDTTFDQLEEDVREVVLV